MNPQPAQPPDLGSLIIHALPGALAGYAGRNYFGGLGGALFGYALYAVFAKPLIFPEAKP